MPAITYEVGAKNQRLRQGLKDSKREVSDFRRAVRDQQRELSRDLAAAAPASKGGLFGQILGGNLATQAVGAAVGKLKEAVKDVGDLVDAQDQLGVSAEKLGRLQRVMQGAGVETENLRKALIALNTARQAAIAGDDKAISKFADLGVSLSDLQHGTLEDTFFKVADGLKATSDEGQRAQRTMDLLGTRQSKLIGEMAKGGEQLKKEMSEVSGAIKNDNAKAVDDLSDSIGNLWGAIKGGATNLVGGGIDMMKKGGTQMKEFATGTEHATQAIEEKTAATEADAKVQQKAAETARLQALRNEAQKKTDAENAEKQNRAAREQADAERDLAASFRESLTQAQRYAGALAAVTAARRKYEKAPSGSVESHEAAAELARAKAGFENERAKQVDRYSMPLADRKAAERADRAAEKAARRGERIYQEQKRDEADRAMSSGRLEKDLEKSGELKGLSIQERQKRIQDEHDKLIRDQRAEKGPGNAKNLPEQTLREISEIRKTMEKLGQNIGIIGG